MTHKTNQNIQSSERCESMLSLIQSIGYEAVAIYFKLELPEIIYFQKIVCNNVALCEL